MGKFYDEYLDKQIKEWKQKYFPYSKMKEIIISIQNEIKFSKENGKPSAKFISIENNNLFDTGVITAKDVIDDFPEIKDNQCYIYLTYFLLEFDKAVKDIYIHYTEIEKDIYVSTNGHLHKKDNYTLFKKSEMQSEIKELKEIAITILSFYMYIDLNIQAMKRILNKFDKKLQDSLQFSISTLYFKRKLTKENSDIKYIVGFKIIIESCAIIESLINKLKQIANKNKYIDNLKKEFNDIEEVIEVINEKKTNRLNNRLLDIYWVQESKSGENIVYKNYPENIPIDARDSYLIGIDEDSFRQFEEEEFENLYNIRMMGQNKFNIFLCFMQTFLYCVFYSFQYIYTKDKASSIALILIFTQVGIFFAQTILSFIKNIKLCLCLSMIFFLVSLYLFGYSLMEPPQYNFIILASLSRFFLGFGSFKIVTRKYILRYLPESKIFLFSLIYIMINIFGLVVGVLLNIVFKSIPIKEFHIFWASINKNQFPYFVAFILILLVLIIIIIFFKVPSDKGDDEIPMLSQKIPEKEHLLSKRSRLLSLSDKRSLSNCEEGIVRMNSENNFTDANLFPKAIDEIKNKDFLHSRTFWFLFLLFSLSIILMRITNEYFILMSSYYLNDTFNENSIIGYIALFFIFSFPIYLILRAKYNLGNEAFYLIIAYIIAIISIILIVIKEFVSQILKGKNALFIVGGCLLMMSTYMIENLCNILSLKLLPKKVNKCHANTKFFLEISKTKGKIIACLLFYTISIQKEEKLKEWICKWTYLILLSIFIIFNLIIYCLRNKLRGKAFNKLILLDY